MDYESHGNDAGLSRASSRHSDCELGIDESERRPLVKSSHEIMNSIDQDLEPTSSSNPYALAGFESHFLLTSARDKDSLRRLAEIIVLVSVTFISVAYLGSYIIKENTNRIAMTNFQATQSSSGMTIEGAHAISPSVVAALTSGEGATASIQTVSDVYVAGNKYSCSDEHITGHCKYMNESALHEPAIGGDNLHPIIYSTIDRKYQIIEYKDESWMCPSQHITEVTCMKGESIRKACGKGLYNHEVVATATSSMYYICAQCPEGTFQDDMDFMGTQCHNCPEGTWVDFTGAQELNRCKETSENHERVYQPKNNVIPDSDIHGPSSVAESKSLQKQQQSSDMSRQMSKLAAVTRVTTAGTITTVTEKK